MESSAASASGQLHEEEDSRPSQSTAESPEAAQSAGTGAQAEQPSPSSTPTAAQSVDEGTASKGAGASGGAIESGDTHGAGPLTQAQLHKRGIIQGLLQCSSPWPDMDYKQLATDAGGALPCL